MTSSDSFTESDKEPADSSSGVREHKKHRSSPRKHKSRAHQRHTTARQDESTKAAPLKRKTSRKSRTTTRTSQKSDKKASKASKHKSKKQKKKTKRTTVGPLDVDGAVTEAKEPENTRTAKGEHQCNGDEAMKAVKAELAEVAEEAEKIEETEEATGAKEATEEVQALEKTKKPDEADQSDGEDVVPQSNAERAGEEVPPATEREVSILTEQASSSTAQSAPSSEPEQSQTRKGHRPTASNHSDKRHKRSSSDRSSKSHRRTASNHSHKSHKRSSHISSRKSQRHTSSDKSTSSPRSRSVSSLSLTDDEDEKGAAKASDSPADSQRRSSAASLQSNSSPPTRLRQDEAGLALGEELRVDQGTEEVLLEDEELLDPDELLTCTICLDDCRRGDMITVTPCKDTFCKDCMREYLRNKIYESEVQDITCPAVDCESHLTDDQIRGAIDESLWNKYLHFKLQSDLRRNKNARWCPKAGCGFGMIGDPANFEMVCTECGMRFCFNCGELWHPEQTCEMFREEALKTGKINKKAEKWKQRHKTKPCPQCRMPIEKSKEGCNHLKCSNCKHEFCWLCMRPYTSDHYDAGNVANGCPNQCFTFEEPLRTRVGRKVKTGFLVFGAVLLFIVALPILLIVVPIYCCCKCCSS
mmetsp:Transcript_2511/g.5989  ORF Transcript_2511/g.5989 Transcript_2511/m.5989 type:complete len:642 (+) Transcript_2511:101-2026(+)